MITGGNRGKWIRVVQADAVITLSHLEENGCYKKVASFEGLKGTSSTTLPFRDTKDDWKILLRILSLQTSSFLLSFTFKIRRCMSCQQLTQSRIRSGTSCCDIRRISLSVGRITYNSHLPSGFSFLQTREYQQSGADVLEHGRTTIPGVGRKVVGWEGILVFLYISNGNWMRFNLGRSCETVQEIES